MTTAEDREYVLGTGDDELNRLGLQHRVWRPRVLDAWRAAGITTGSRVLDVGSGPGYATVDLAEIVGPRGKVIAVEQSERFVRHARHACDVRGLTNVTFIEADLMQSPLPAFGADAAWCRWVACFVSDPSRLVTSIAGALREGGVVVFHEYGDYGSWRFAPRRPVLEEFVAQVMASWRAAGGEPDIGLELPHLLRAAGLQVRSVESLVFSVSPADFIWKWPAAFIRSGLDRLFELGRIDTAFAESVRRELDAAESDPTSIMITPHVLEIIANRPFAK